MAKKKVKKSSPNHRKNTRKNQNINVYFLLLVAVGVGIYAFFTLNKNVSKSYKPYFSVAALEGPTGASGPSGTTGNSTPTPIHMPPTAPTNLKATYNLSTVNGTPSTYTLTWGPSTSSITITNYYVVKNLAYGTSVPPTTLTYTVNDTDNQNYPINGPIFNVRAFDSQGYSSAYSNTAGATGLTGEVLWGYQKGKKYYQQALVGARVDASANGVVQSTTTNYKGVYFINTAPGTYTVTFSSRGLRSQTFTMTVEQNHAAVKTVKLVQ